jgi:Carboxypeptidase regulatory-like domain
MLTQAEYCESRSPIPHGSPASDISVILFSPDRVRQAKTDKAGKVEFTELPFQTYELQASGVSFAEVNLPDILIISDDPINLNIPLKLFASSQESDAFCPPPLAIDVISGFDQEASYEERAGTVSVTGNISGLSRDRPLKGATITLVKFETPENGISQATSDDNGVYEFKDIEPGKYSLTASRNGIMEKPYNFHFWVTRENLTRIGRIYFGLSHAQDNCGGAVIVITPAILPISSPPLEQVFPLPLPFPPRRMSASPR